MAYFFLSYAHEGDPTEVQTFYDKLSAEVGDLAGEEVGVNVGFYDQRISLGTEWTEHLTTALSSCRCFVALISPRYFQRHNCGREWGVFESRLTDYQRTHGGLPPVLFPVLWIPTAMPDLVQRFQWADGAVGGGNYKDLGLRQIQRLQQFSDDYIKLVSRLAQKIVDAQSHPIPAPRTPVSFSTAPDVFAPHRPPLPRGGTAQAQTPGQLPAPRQTPETERSATPEPATSVEATAGTRHVNLVVVAGARNEMQATGQRKDLDYYGPTVRDWAPYSPENDRSLSQQATVIAIDRNFHVDVDDTSRLEWRLNDAQAKNQLVVLLVDPWSVFLADREEALRAYDRRNEPTSALLIPFSKTDPETQDHADVLAGLLSGVIVRTVRAAGPMFRTGLGAPGEFTPALEEVLEIAQNRLFNTGQVQVRFVPSAMQRPILEGPGSLEGGSR
jgi:FxsC-like protein